VGSSVALVAAVNRHEYFRWLRDGVCRRVRVIGSYAPAAKFGVDLVVGWARAAVVRRHCAAVLHVQLDELVRRSIAQRLAIHAMALLRLRLHFQRLMRPASILTAIYH